VRHPQIGERVQDGDLGPRIADYGGSISVTSPSDGLAFQRWAIGHFCAGSLIDRRPLFPEINESIV
jgi:hypothetical protein